MRVQSTINNKEFQEDHFTVSKILSRVVKGVNQLAVPIIALEALGCLPKASAGPVAYASCVAGCEALAAISTAGFGATIATLKACISACLPILGAQTPYFNRDH